MLKAILITYLVIGLAFALFNILVNKIPWKTLLLNILIGPVILVLMFRDALRKKQLKIGE